MVRGIVARVVALGVAGALALTGCSEDEELTKAEFIAKGDALCEELYATVDPKFNAMSADFPDFDMAQAEAEFPAIIEAFDDFERDIAGLEGPEADKRAIDALEADNQRIGKALDKAGTAAEQGDEAAFKKAMFDAFPLFEAGAERSRAYGFKICGKDDDGDEDETEAALLRFAYRLGPRPKPAPVLPPEQEEFVRRADALCKKTSEQVEPKLGPVFAGDLEKAAPAIREILPLQRDLVVKLLELVPAEGARQGVKGLIDTQEQAVIRIESLLEAAEARDKARYDAAFKQVMASFGALETAYAKYGFRECGR